MKSIINNLHQSQAGGEPSYQTLRECFSRIDRSHLNAFISLDQQGAIAAARFCDDLSKRGSSLGILHGVPVAVKDIIDVVGLSTTNGSERFANAPAAARDADVVRRLRCEGAVIVGKTNTHEFAYGPTGDRSFFGPVKNPFNTAHISGGSSSGSAAAVASGMCLAALGSDTGASIRLPAALCGIVGLKPTYGLVSCQGVFAVSHTLDHVGPMTRTVFDSAVMLEAMTGRIGVYTSELRRAATVRRVGLVRRYYGDYLTEPVAKAWREAELKFREFGIDIAEVDIPAIQAISEAQHTVILAESYAAHSEALQRGEPYSDETRNRLLGGATISADEYIRTLRYRQFAIDAFDRALESVDAILVPTCGSVAPLLGERSFTIGGENFPMFRFLTRLTAPTNFTGHPCISVPFGSNNGLPIGMQLIAKHNDEGSLLALARLLESAQE